MPCYRPLKGWRSRSTNPSGKRSIVFNLAEGFADLPVDLPCGQCIGCRLERSRMWALRCIHENKSHEESSFLTLTYSPENLPSDGSLVKKHMQDFFKRLRRKLEPKKIRYFYCGEYGEKLSRPHYHVLLFGHDFNDKEIIKGGENPLYTSEVLASLWGLGFVTIGEVTFDSAAYVARYITKKVTGDDAEAHYDGRLPEYIDMSRRPAIGKEFALKYKSQILEHGHVVHDGLKLRPPRYYEKIYQELGDDEKIQLAKIKKKREDIARQQQEADPRYDAIIQKGEVAKLKFKQIKRSYEDG